jgi:cyclophilin family peptidyl-prolyl cis-trans isomerase
MIFFFLYLNSDGTGDIYEKFFDDENFLYQHSKPGLLSMSNNNKPNTNCSEFFITTAAAPSLNGKFVKCLNSLILLFTVFFSLKG